MSTQDPLLSDQFQEAFNYAFKLHRNQIRKGSYIPYLSHLMAVAALVLESGGDEEEAIAALLHDAVEDQGGFDTLLQIRELFGERVASIVEECTDSFSIPKPPWRDRKLDYLQRLEHASPSALRVSLADKLHNIRSLSSAYFRDGEEIWKRFRGGKEGTMWYYHQLSTTFHKHGETQMLTEFDRVLGRLDRLIENKHEEQ
jgi:(p)ppGpp synthase/HD superfamily hydrolase